MSKRPAACAPRGAPPQHVRKLCLQCTEEEPGHINGGLVAIPLPCPGKLLAKDQRFATSPFPRGYFSRAISRARCWLCPATSYPRAQPNHGPEPKSILNAHPYRWPQSELQVSAPPHSVKQRKSSRQDRHSQLLCRHTGLEPNASAWDSQYAEVRLDL